MPGAPFLTYARLVKQTGGMCMFAVVVLAWHPHPVLVIENGTSKEHFPPEFFPGVEEGVRETIGDRLVRVVMVDGMDHPVDSSHRSFNLAARLAAREALGRLPRGPGPTDPRSALEITADWKADRELRLASLTEELTRKLEGFHYEEGCWWQSGKEVERLIHLSTNAPHVPTEVDLRLSFSCPRLLEFLRVGETWREAPGRLPQELSSRKLSHLVSRQFELNESAGGELYSALRDSGIPYFERFGSLPGLLAAPGYMDSGTRSALQLLSGDSSKARSTATRGLENCLGNPRQKKFCERVLKALGEKSENQHHRHPDQS